MATFEYTALNREGAAVRGVLNAGSEDGVLGELEARRLTPVSVSERRAAGSRRGRVPTAALANAYGQLADLLRAGVPLAKSLALLARQKKRPRLAAAFGEILQVVQDGGEMSAGMEQIGDVFPPVHVAMVRAGEEGGFLEDVLQRLAELVRKQAELNAKVIGSIIYPAVLVGLGSIILTGVFAFLVPMFKPTFERLDQLPAITSFVFGVSDLITQYWFAIPIVAGGLFFGARWALRRPDVSRRWVVLKSKAPVIGPMFRSIACSRFCRMLGTMEGNGVPLLRAMSIAQQAAGNSLMEDAIAEAAESVRAGEPLAGPLGASGLFDDDVIEMIAVGEAAGSIDHVLLNVAETIDTRIERSLESAVKLIEPLLIVAIAGAVGVLAVSLILPITQLSGAM